MARKTYTDAEIESYDQVLQGFPDTPPRRTRKAVVEKLRDRIIDLLERGFTYEDIQQRLASKDFEISVHTLKEYVLEGKGRAGKRRARRVSKKSPAAAVASPAPAVQPDPDPADAHSRPASSVESASGPGDEVAAALVEVAGPESDAPSGGDDLADRGEPASGPVADDPGKGQELDWQLCLLDRFPELAQMGYSELYRQRSDHVNDVAKSRRLPGKKGKVTIAEWESAEQWLKGEGESSDAGVKMRLIEALLEKMLRERWS